MIQRADSIKIHIMRKLFTLFPLILAPMVTVAAGETPVRKNFVGFYIIQPNITVKTTNLVNNKHTLETLGFGLGFGWNVVGDIGLELEAMTVSLGLKTVPQTNTMTNYSVFVGMRYGKEYFGFLRPYIGVGVGPSVWNNAVRYNYVIDSTTYSGRYSKNRFNLAYQAKIGTSFILSEKFDADFQVKYQNLGRIPSNGPLFDMTGDVTNIEYRIGFIYKY